LRQGVRKIPHELALQRKQVKEICICFPLIIATNFIIWSRKNKELGEESLYFRITRKPKMEQVKKQPQELGSRSE